MLFNDLIHIDYDIGKHLQVPISCFLKIFLTKMLLEY